jgi:hypothetical protein
VHAHREIAALNIRCADVLPVRFASNDFALCPNAFRRAIARFRLRIGTINLLQHGVVNILAKHGINGDQVRPVAVTGELHAVC